MKGMWHSSVRRKAAKKQRKPITGRSCGIWGQRKPQKINQNHKTKFFWSFFIRKQRKLKSFLLQGFQLSYFYQVCFFLKIAVAVPLTKWKENNVSEGRSCFYKKFSCFFMAGIDVSPVGEIPQNGSHGTHRKHHGVPVWQGAFSNDRGVPMPCPV